MSQQQGVQFGFAIAGAVVGAFAGAPALGYAVGSVLGAVVAQVAFPPEPTLYEQQSIADISVTAPTVGKAKPHLWGTGVLGGNIVWGYPKQETVHTVEEGGGAFGKGGFGGPTSITKTKTYRIHMIVALCVGPVQKINKIWYDTTIVYDEAQPGAWTVATGLANGDPGGPSEDPDTIIYERVGETLERFTLFRGTETQEPWAFAEALAEVGEGAIPAYRSTACVGVTLDLGVTGRVPNLRFETTTTEASLALPVAMSYMPNEQSIWLLYAAGSEAFRGVGRAVGYFQEGLTPNRVAYLSDLTQAEDLDILTRPVLSAYGQTNGGFDALIVQLRSGGIVVVNAAAGIVDIPIIEIRTAEEIAEETEVGWRKIITRPDINGNLTIISYLLPLVPALGEFATRTGTPSSIDRLVLGDEPGDVVWNEVTQHYYVSLVTDGTVVTVTPGPLSLDETLTGFVEPRDMLVASDDRVWLTDRGGDAVYHFTEVADLSSPIPVGAQPKSPIEANDGYIWVANTGALTVTRINPSDDSTETFALPAPPLVVLGALTDGKCWVLSQAARQLYLMQSDGTIEGHVQVPRGSEQLALDTTGAALVLAPASRQLVRIDAALTGAQYIDAHNGLACVVREIATMAGVPPEWIDTSGLDQRPTNFLQVGVGAASLLLDSLATAYQFTYIENAYGLKFFFKGGSAVAQIPEASLSAGSNSALTEGFALARQQETDLPTEVTIQYASPQRNFSQDAQTAVKRTNPGAHNPVIVPLPVAFPDPQEPKDLAEIMLYEPPYARSTGLLHLPPAAMRLEAADIIQVTSRDFVHTVHLTGLGLGQHGALELQTVGHRSFLYEGFAGIPGESLGNTYQLPREAQVSAVIVDAPPIDASDTELRFFVALSRGTKGDAFPLTAIYESRDAGSTYTPVLTVLGEAIIGDVAVATPDAPTHAWDDGTAIDVVLRSPAQTLSSAAEGAVLNGTVNLVQIGAEVLSFATAMLIGPRVYRLTRLIRGRRGTEGQTAGHVANESLVVLTHAALRQSMARSYAPEQLGAQALYKIVPLHADIATVTPVAFTPQGISWKPWAPVVTGLVSQGETGAFTLTWWHRSRLAGAWINNSGIAWDPLDLRTYRITIYADGNYDTVQATYILSSPTAPAEGLRSWDYMQAMQITDFGAAQSVLFLDIVQMMPGVAGYATRASSLSVLSLPVYLDFEQTGTNVVATVAEDFEA